jgi:phosphoglycerate dehydrogenase-like enzyme
MNASMTNSKPTIVICDDYEQSALSCANWASVQSQANLVIHTQAFADEASTVVALKDAQVVCLMRERTPFPERIIAQLPNLKLVVFSGQRNLSLDSAACKARGIAIANTDWGPNKASTAEQTWALILACTRRVTHAERGLREGQWRSSYALPATLYGHRLGVIGLGSIGSKVAAVGLALGMEVVAWSQNLTAERAAEQGVKWVSKAELVATSQVISLHLVLSERSRHIISKNELSAVRDDAVIVNTSRAGLIDEAALIHALETRPQMMAGLDVFNQEPLPLNAPLLKLPNAVLAPHLGYVSQPVFERFFAGFEAACSAYLANDLPRLGEHLL